MTYGDFAATTADWNGIRPIDARCVEAALRLRAEHLRGWNSSVEALLRMRQDLPELTRSNILAKSATVNDVYNVQVGSAVLTLADFIYKRSVEGTLVNPDDSPGDVVERIGFLGDGSADRTGYQVFASKYAHFFLDPDRFPVYDKYAARALLYHWGSFEPSVMDGKRRYRNFCHALERVRSASQLDGVSLADLDAFLWLAGVHREWLRYGAKAAVNAEVKRFFELHAGTDDEAGRLLEQLVPGADFHDDLPHAR